MTARTLYMMEISRKLQGRHELHFHPLVGKRKNELSLNFGKSIYSSTLKDNLSAIS